MNIIIRVLVIAALLALWPIAVLAFALAWPVLVWRALPRPETKERTAAILAQKPGFKSDDLTRRIFPKESFFSPAHKLVPKQTGCRVTKVKNS